MKRKEAENNYHLIAQSEKNFITNMLSEEYRNRFGGIERLYGPDGLEALSKFHVMIIGLGGVGSWAAESLARTGVGKMSLVDLDDLCITNTNRQIHAHEGNYGKLKSQALKERILYINPEAEVNTIETFYSEKNSDFILSHEPDFIVDAIDMSMSKSFLIAECRDREIPIICSGGAGGKKDPSQVKVDDFSKVHGDRLLHSVRTQLRKRYGFPRATNKKRPPFHIKTVFSPEEMTAPPVCETSQENRDITPRNLNCATGYGAVAHVTSIFGFFCASEAIKECIKKEH